MTRRWLGPPRAHRATTVEMRALYPFVVPAPLSVDGCYLGREASGEIFCFDPWDCYAGGELTNPNMVVLGQIGRGKSAFVKSFLWRQLAFGRRCWVIDPKGEYGPLAEAYGARPLQLGPGLSLRLNPLEVCGPERSGADRSGHRRRAELLAVLLSSSLGRPLLPEERAALDVALGATEAHAAVPVLPAVADALLNPGPGQAVDLGTDLEGLRHDGRQVALELRRLTRGDLAGMFDDHTSPDVDLGAEVVVLDLSRLYASPALGLLMVCALSWLQSAMVAPAAGKRLVVLDEAWAVMSQPATAQWLQMVFKLARSYGVANVAVAHRVSDFRAAGDDGSRQQRLAEGLLADAETRVVFGQAPGEAEQAGAFLGLNATEQAIVSQLPRGAALWKVGRRTYLVDHELSELELSMTDTDAAMRE